MKLDDLRRKAVSGISSNRKVEKPTFRRSKAKSIRIKCYCGTIFSCMSDGVARCPVCSKENLPFECANSSCDNRVRIEEGYCNDCCASGIPTGFVRQFSGKEGIDRCVSCNSTNLDHKMGVCKDCGYIQSEIALVGDGSGWIGD